HGTHHFALNQVQVTAVFIKPQLGLCAGIQFQAGAVRQGNPAALAHTCLQGGGVDSLGTEQQAGQTGSAGDGEQCAGITDQFAAAQIGPNRHLVAIQQVDQVLVQCA